MIHRTTPADLSYASDSLSSTSGERGTPGKIEENRRYVEAPDVSEEGEDRGRHNVREQEELDRLTIDLGQWSVAA